MHTLILLVAVLFAFFSNCEAESRDRFEAVKSINPIMRYWAQNRLRRKLPILEKLAAKSRQDGGSEKYRNCFFSPVQCQLPVVIKADPLVTALQVDQSQPAFVRFRTIIDLIATVTLLNTRTCHIVRPYKPFVSKTYYKEKFSVFNQTTPNVYRIKIVKAHAHEIVLRNMLDVDIDISGWTITRKDPYEQKDFTLALPFLESDCVIKAFEDLKLIPGDGEDTEDKVYICNMRSFLVYSEGVTKWFLDDDEGNEECAFITTCRI